MKDGQGKSSIVPRQARGIHCVKVVRMYYRRRLACDFAPAVVRSRPRDPAVGALPHYGRKKFGGHAFRVSFVGTMESIWRWKGARPYRKEISVDLTIHAVSTGRAFLIPAVHENAVSAHIVDALPEERVVAYQDVGVEPNHPVVVVEPAVVSYFGQCQYGALLVPRVLQDANRHASASKHGRNQRHVGRLAFRLRHKEHKVGLAEQRALGN